MIHDLQDNTFFASISLQQGQLHHTIDARPSDAIALAIAAKAPDSRRPPCVAGGSDDTHGAGPSTGGKNVGDAYADAR